MSTHSPGGASGFDTGQIDEPVSASAGMCGSCGRALPPPDLEGAASEIDHTLSLESGRLVPRSAWAGRPPDGLMDTLFAWLPSAKARRRLWERGQQLWTERMTAELSGPCLECRGLGLPPAGSSETVMQRPDNSVVPPVVQPTRGSTEAVAEFSDSPTYAAIPSVADQPSGPAADLSEDGPTRAVTLPEESATTAMPAMPVAAQPPGVPGHEPAVTDRSAADDEHEAHTVIFTAMPKITGAPRLVVIEGPVHGHQFSLSRQATTLGRSIGCHVTVEDDAVAYDHARVVRDPGGWHVEPVGGAETFVNDVPIKAGQPLKVGDVIQIGPARFRFEEAG